MHKIFIALAIVVLTAGSAAAQKADVMKTVNQFVDGFNKGDTKTVVAACAENTSIIDEFPPHEWHGAGSCQNWANDYDADAKKNGITDGIVTLGKPKHLDFNGDRAYVVIPSNYAFKREGKPVKEIGSIFTFVLEKTETGWHITGWSWAKH